MVFGCKFHRRRHHHHHHHLKMLHLSRYVLKYQAINPGIQSLRITSNSFFNWKAYQLVRNLLSTLED
jgi:hypothetical protein